ncbi:aspartate kinase [Bacillus sp. RG28]|uniref:Aspartokinase n=1 Tax=Gottfriedia endophytica TaxID=2820819 RepID=A0A940SJ84_9BACI|nr:aspartate kinase [Gottfriedia endophytica]MBP0723963.1 aspartate kinase [Gottfriedia endophytica]
MRTIVQKFGGTSVGSIERIQHVANTVIRAYEEGMSIVTVVSAMGHHTDELVDLAKQINPDANKREMDMLLSTGEQVSISLLAMAIQAKGYKAISLTGWQAGVQTESIHSNARINHIDTTRIQQFLNEDYIVIVAGFQGISSENEITTLGRGGSDTTAVALAAALKAERCDIYTDVTGVYTTDPRMVKAASKLSYVSYDEMLELAALGAGVLHPRAVEFAKNYQIKLQVRSSQIDEIGTFIGEDIEMEQQTVVRGIAFESDITRMTLNGLFNRVDLLPSIFTLLAREGIDVDIIIHSVTSDNLVNLSFSINSVSMIHAIKLLEDNKEQLGYVSIDVEGELAKVSIVGSGMVSNPGVAAKMFQYLGEQGITIKMVSTSEIKVSTVISKTDLEKAVHALHSSFELDSISKLQVVEK